MLLYKLFRLWEHSQIAHNGMLLTSTRMGENGFFPYYMGISHINIPRPFFAFRDKAEAYDYACGCAGYTVCLSVEAKEFMVPDRFELPHWVESVTALPKGTVWTTEFEMPAKKAFDPLFVCESGLLMTDGDVAILKARAMKSWGMPT